MTLYLGIYKIISIFGLNLASNVGLIYAPQYGLKNANY